MHGRLGQNSGVSMDAVFLDTAFGNIFKRFFFWNISDVQRVFTKNILTFTTSLRVPPFPLPTPSRPPEFH